MFSGDIWGGRIVRPSCEMQLWLWRGEECPNFLPILQTREIYEGVIMEGPTSTATVIYIVVGEYSPSNEGVGCICEHGTHGDPYVISMMAKSLQSLHRQLLRWWWAIT